ncbi:MULTISPECIES: LysR family transcriptional regulator [Microbacterium]|uniref:LysR family transcriptional regulator n=1 Tax=Microbacterium TaxID=33882 RepID=UPI0027810EFC|nr:MULTISPECIES: LysR family transcriptional regulator [Microbacterium]MDQ1085158.1 DNA-binding transcriptional LysR family regulator [Microbacterium sp. SORGH_AS_0344]MDQ1169536.1 DNA-binding transcriptional LysR family regulator [Microbacterium proteolyticum]
MEIRELTYFIAVAEDLSFTRAAARLQMTQPPLSQAIARLEKRLGTRLFERRARMAPRLTPAGHLLLAEGKRILQQIDQTEALLDSVVADVFPLRVGSNSSVLGGLLPTVVRDFRRTHPTVRLLIEESEEMAVLSDIARGSIDFGFTRVWGIDDRFEVDYVGMEPLVCAVHADHPIAGRDSVSLVDLADEDFVTFHREDAPQAFDRILTACIRAGFNPRIPLRAANDLSLLSIVACGLAVSIMPSVSSYIPIPGVRFVPIQEEWAATPLSMVWLSGQPNPVMSAFIRAVRAELLRRRDQDRALGRREMVLNLDT